MISRRHRDGGQALSEFALVIGAFIAILMGIATFGVVIVQQWGVSQVAQWLGARITEQGTFDSAMAAELRSFARGIGVDLEQPGATIDIWIPGASGPYHWPSDTDQLTVAYGDYVRVELTEPVHIPFAADIPLIGGAVASIEHDLTVRGGWSGIAQRDSPCAGACPTPFGTPPLNDLAVYVSDAYSGQPLTGVSVTVDGSPCSPQAIAGRYLCQRQLTGPQTVSAIASGYRSFSRTLNPVPAEMAISLVPESLPSPTP